MSESDFKNIFGSQIAEGEIGAHWATKYQSLFTQPPPLHTTATSKYGGV